MWRSITMLSITLSDFVKRYGYWALLAIWLLLLVGTPFLICQMVSAAVFNGLSCPEGKASSANVEYLTRSKLPTSVSNIDSYQVGGFYKYCEAYLRFEIDPADLNTFIASTRIKLQFAPQANLKEFDSYHEKNPWKPNSSLTYFYARGPRSLDYTQTIYVDTTNPQRYVVYMTVEYESF